ncbi:MAG: hypothetical protein ACRENJ_06420, partial [Candidatus Eiseniibacteriota bacterium]
MKPPDTMLERIRLRRTIALGVIALGLLLHATAGRRASASAGEKAADYATATVGAPIGVTAEKPRAEDAADLAVTRRVGTPGVFAGADASTTAAIVNQALCTAAANQTSEVLLADGAGGSVLVWQDARAGEWDVFAQQLGVAGLTQWVPNGVPVCKAAGAQTRPQAVSDNAGGVIVVWQDARAGATDIYAQRLNAAGAALWATGGVLVCGAGGDQKAPVVVGDGQGGA